jgi:hypothetical protein
MRATKTASPQEPASQVDAHTPSPAEVAAAVKEVERAGKAAMQAATEGATEVAAEIAATAGVELRRDLEQFQKIWKSPATQLGLTLSRDDAFLGAVGWISKNPKGSELFAYEGVLILALWAFRAWKLGKVNTLFRQMLTQAWISLVYWLVALFAIPSLVWGEHYRVALSHLFRGVLRHFLS